MGDVPLWVEAAEDKYDASKDGSIECKEKKEYRSIEEIEKANQSVHTMPPVVIVNLL